MKPMNWISATGSQPGGGHADGDPADRELGERRIDHPLLAEFLQQALGRAEHAAVGADVLAEHHDALVLAHRPGERHG